MKRSGTIDCATIVGGRGKLVIIVEVVAVLNAREASHEQLCIRHQRKRHSAIISAKINKKNTVGLLLFPSRPRHPGIFCRLQSEAFDAASLFKINHVVH